MTDMDDFYTHIHHLPRRVPHQLPVHSLGYFRRKDHETRGLFTMPSLSLILSGGGWYSCDGIEHAVHPPCALWEPAGGRMHYGPRPRWEEFFIVWHQTDMKTLSGSGLYRPAAKVWRLPSREALRPWFDRLSALARHPAAPGAVDRIDRLAEQLAAESVLLAEPERPHPALEMVRLVRAGIDADPLADPGIAAVAHAAGVGIPAFTRRWLVEVGEPLGRYRLRARINLGCRLLAETGLPVAEVARRCGFADPLYFSRRFARTTGRPATTWRRENRLVR